MRPQRASRGFQRAGAIGVEGLGLPSTQARSLRLAHAWHSVAGAAIARRASAVALRRGVLEVEVDDPRWLDTLRRLVPRLAGRLAASFPDLGLTRVRLRLRGERSEPESLALAAGEAAATESEPAGAASHEPLLRDGLTPAERLALARDRYLARHAGDRDPAL